LSISGIFMASRALGAHIAAEALDDATFAVHGEEAARTTMTAERQGRDEVQARRSNIKPPALARRCHDSSNRVASGRREIVPLFLGTKQQTFSSNLGCDRPSSSTFHLWHVCRIEAQGPSQTEMNVDVMSCSNRRRRPVAAQAVLLPGQG